MTAQSSNSPVEKSSKPVSRIRYLTAVVQRVKVGVCRKRTSLGIAGCAVPQFYIVRVYFVTSCRQKSISGFGKKSHSALTIITELFDITLVVELHPSLRRITILKFIANSLKHKISKPPPPREEPCEVELVNVCSS